MRTHTLLSTARVYSALTLSSSVSSLKTFPHCIAHTLEPPPPPPLPGPTFSCVYMARRASHGLDLTHGPCAYTLVPPLCFTSNSACLFIFNK